jgi:hypothetical protein
MKVLIEKTPKLKGTLSNVNYQPLVILMGIVKVANKSKNLISLRADLKLIDKSGYEYGFGASHCWVKQIGNDSRILLILE